MSKAQNFRLNEKIVFSEIMNKLDKRLSDEDLISLNMHRNSFVMTLNLLTEIWSRIQEDAKLHNEYWHVYAELYDPYADERKPTLGELGILKSFDDHWFRLNLDIEDWFIHSYILLDKFAKFAKKLVFLLSRQPEERRIAARIPDKNFDKYKRFYINPRNRNSIKDTEYLEIITSTSSWYNNDLKNVRDDLIQHELVPKFWTYDTSCGKIRIGRIRHSKELVQTLYTLRDKYATIYPEIRDENNFFSLLSFFEGRIGKLDHLDADTISKVRKQFGRNFPDIPGLFSKMTNFFSLVNDHFIGIIEDHFE